MNTTAGRYVLGFVALLVIVGSLTIAAVAIRRRFLEDWTGAPARLAELVSGLALLIGLLELLGAVGWFGFAGVVGACLVAALLIARRFGPLRTVAPARTPLEPPARGWSVRIAWLLALLGAATVFAEWGALTAQSYDVGIRGFDSLWYHLPWAASFAQTGRITTLRFTDVEYLTAFYPATAEMLHGLGIVLLGRDTISPALNLLW
ncbi:MAG TPA: hypothetical protein VHX88_12260, partial [Solirubrobacteraceae bacterium]|nr:hypothetical protein [Solirubrobacteraceae bacterium]